MDFGLSEEQLIFQDALCRYLAERVPMERVRGIMQGSEGFDASLLLQLGEQGVTGILIPEAYGGSGLGLLDASVAAEALGAAAAPLGFQSACVMSPLVIAAVGSQEQRARWLPEMAAGRALVAFADGAPAVQGGVLRGGVRFVPDAQAAEAFVVRAGDDQLLLIPRDTPGVSVAMLAVVDETRRVGEVKFENVKIEDEMQLRANAISLERILDAGRIALAADALGAAQRALDAAVRYSMDRRQFNRVIASFQAVKHICAEVAADIEPLRSMLWYAAFAWDDERPDAELVAKSLKAHAAEVGVSATTACVQVFGGMGFTWECDVHLWFKRTGYDRQLLGSPAEMRARAATLMLS